MKTVGDIAEGDYLYFRTAKLFPVKSGESYLETMVFINDGVIHDTTVEMWGNYLGTDYLNTSKDYYRPPNMDTDFDMYYYLNSSVIPEFTSLDTKKFFAETDGEKALKSYFDSYIPADPQVYASVSLTIKSKALNREYAKEHLHLVLESMRSNFGEIPNCSVSFNSFMGESWFEVRAMGNSVEYYYKDSATEDINGVGPLEEL